MPALLGLIPARLLIVLAIAAAILGWGAYQRHQVKASAAVALQAQQSLAKVQADAAKVAIDALAAQVSTQQKAVDEAQTNAEQNRVAAADAAGALQRLRQRLAAANAGGSAAVATAGASAPARAGPDLCADMLGRVGEAAGRIAATADQRRTAGKACERIADGEVKP